MNAYLTYDRIEDRRWVEQQLDDEKGRCEQVPDMRSCLSSGAMEQGSS